MTKKYIAPQMRVRKLHIQLLSDVSQEGLEYGGPTDETNSSGASSKRSFNWFDEDDDME